MPLRVSVVIWYRAGFWVGTYSGALRLADDAKEGPGLKLIRLWMDILSLVARLSAGYRSGFQPSVFALACSPRAMPWAGITSRLWRWGVPKTLDDPAKEKQTPSRE